MALKKKYNPGPAARSLRLLAPARGASHKAEPNEASQHLWAAVYLPQLALDVLGLGPAAAACSEEKGGRVLLSVCNAAARASGLQSGMTVNAAKALNADVVIKTRLPEAEQQEAERLAALLYRFSALIHLRESNLLLLELRASQALFKGLAPLLAAIRQQLKPRYSEFSLAVAPTPNAAILLALAGDEEPLLRRVEITGRVAALPLDFISYQQPKLWPKLQRLGLKTYGQLLRLPRAGLQKRFGAELPLLLARLLGKQQEPLGFWQPPSEYAKTQELMAELSGSEQLMPALVLMLEALCAWLQQRGAKIQRFQFGFFDAKHCLGRIEVAFLRPSNRPELMSKLLALRLEREVFAAPVLSLELSAQQLLYPPSELGQQQLWALPEERAQKVWDSLEAIQNKLGPQAVCGLALNNDHRPQSAWQAVMPGETRSAAVAPGPRPLWLYPQPRRLNVSERRALTLLSRPERISSGWWDSDPVCRDYFVALLGQKKLWVFRELAAEVATNNATWYCHGGFE